MHDWRSTKLTNDYLEGVRGGIPLAKTQIETIIRIIRELNSEVNTFMDLGCGDGILGRNLFLEWPDAKGLFIDFSEPMLDEAIKKCGEIPNNSELLLIDYGKDQWHGPFKTMSPSFDVIISGYSIHHQEDYKKHSIYQDIFDILNPGGVFLNLEHVASRTEKGERLFDETFVDSLWEFHKMSGLSKTREEVSDNFYDREDKTLNKLTLTETQCDWLREIGFEEVDIYFKFFELALFGGQKPTN